MKHRFKPSILFWGLSGTITTGIFLFSASPIFAASLQPLRSKFDVGVNAEIYAHYELAIRAVDSDSQQGLLNPLDVQASAEASGYGGTARTRAIGSAVFHGSDAGQVNALRHYFIDGPQPPPDEVAVAGSTSWYQYFEYEFRTLSDGKLIVNYDVSSIIDAQDWPFEEGFVINGFVTRVGTGTIEIPLVRDETWSLGISPFWRGVGGAGYMVGGGNTLQGVFDWRFEPLSENSNPVTSVPTPMLVPGLVCLFFKTLYRKRKGSLAEEV